MTNEDLSLLIQCCGVAIAGGGFIIALARWKESPINDLFRNVFSNEDMIWVCLWVGFALILVGFMGWGEPDGSSESQSQALLFCFFPGVIILIIAFYAWLVKES